VTINQAHTIGVAIAIHPDAGGDVAHVVEKRLIRMVMEIGFTITLLTIGVIALAVIIFK
jgi:hypothetical protein